MADIQQWRRMIHTSRSRTPANDLEEQDRVTSPLTPRRGLRPTLSSYFSQNIVSTLTLKPEASFSSLNAELCGPKLPSWPEDEPFPEPTAEVLIDSVLCQLMSKPYQPLDVRFNGPLLQIFERFRALSADKGHLLTLLDDGVKERARLELRMKQDQHHWVDDRQMYKAEIKRLELLLAKGKRGLAEVTIARQDSALRRGKQPQAESSDDGLEAILDLLEKSRQADNRVWSSQRAAFRTRAPSPSAQMRRLSKQLTMSTSANNVHSELAFGAPPGVVPSTLAEPSLFEEQTARAREYSGEGHPHPLSDDMASSSDESFNWPLEVAPIEDPKAETMGPDHDPAAIEYDSTNLFHNRPLAPEQTMPRHLDVFDIRSPRSTSMPSGLDSPEARLKPGHAISTFASSTVRKQPTLISKASGFFHRRKAQAGADIVTPDKRRYSLDTGDDVEAVTTEGRGTANRQAAGNSASLRRSMSLARLSELMQSTDVPERTASPLLPELVQYTPPSELKRASRIPTPVYYSSHLARPRQERGDSSSTLLTAIRHADQASRRLASAGSSEYTSPSLSCVDFRAHHSDPPNSGKQKSASNKTLSSRNDATRGSPRAVETAQPEELMCYSMISDRTNLQPEVASRALSSPAEWKQ